MTIPLVNREIPIIADGLLADPTLGTGCVKVTPAHDPNDYACWQRNPQIGIINILNPDGTINENGGKYKGLDRYKAREAVINDMEELGLFEGKEDRDDPAEVQRPQQDADRAVPVGPVVREDGDRDDGKPGLAQIGDGRGDRAIAWSSFLERMPGLISIGSARSAIGASAGSCGGGIGFRCGDGRGRRPDRCLEYGMINPDLPRTSQPPKIGSNSAESYSGGTKTVCTMS